MTSLTITTSSPPITTGEKNLKESEKLSSQSDLDLFGAGKAQTNQPDVPATKLAQTSPNSSLNQIQIPNDEVKESKYEVKEREYELIDNESEDESIDSEEKRSEKKRINDEINNNISFTVKSCMDEIKKGTSSMKLRERSIFLEEFREELKIYKKYGTTPIKFRDDNFKKLFMNIIGIISKGESDIDIISKGESAIARTANVDTIRTRLGNVDMMLDTLVEKITELAKTHYRCETTPLGTSIKVHLNTEMVTYRPLQEDPHTTIEDHLAELMASKEELDPRDVITWLKALSEIVDDLQNMQTHNSNDIVFTFISNYVSKKYANWVGDHLIPSIISITQQPTTTKWNPFNKGKNPLKQLNKFINNFKNQINHNIITYGNKIKELPEVKHIFNAATTITKVQLEKDIKRWYNRIQVLYKGKYHTLYLPTNQLDRYMKGGQLNISEYINDLINSDSTLANILSNNKELSQRLATSTIITIAQNAKSPILSSYGFEEGECRAVTKHSTSYNVLIKLDDDPNIDSVIYLENMRLVAHVYGGEGYIGTVPYIQHSTITVTRNSNFISYDFEDIFGTEKNMNIKDSDFTGNKNTDNEEKHEPENAPLIKNILPGLDITQVKTTVKTELLQSDTMDL